MSQTVNACLRLVLAGVLAGNLILHSAGRTHAGNNTLTTAGDILQYATPAAGVLISAAKGDTEGIWQWGGTVLVTAGITHGLKFATNNTSWGKRPNGDDYSFPSGHASAAFSGAAYLHYRYGWEYGLPAALLASLVAYSRVESDQHHVRDVIAGAAIAYAVGYFLTDHYNKDVTLLPYVEWSRKPLFGIIAVGRF